MAFKIYDYFVIKGLTDRQLINKIVKTAKTIICIFYTIRYFKSHMQISL